MPGAVRLLSTKVSRRDGHPPAMAREPTIGLSGNGAGTLSRRAGSGEIIEVRPHCKRVVRRLARSLERRSRPHRSRGAVCPRRRNRVRPPDPAARCRSLQASEHRPSIGLWCETVRISRLSLMGAARRSRRTRRSPQRRCPVGRSDAVTGGGLSGRLPAGPVGGTPCGLPTAGLRAARRAAQVPRDANQACAWGSNPARYPSAQA